MCEGTEDVASLTALRVIKGVIVSCISLVSGLNLGFGHISSQVHLILLPIIFVFIADIESWL